MEIDECLEIKKLRDYKRGANISYENLGHALGVTGITVYNWMRLRHAPSPVVKKAINAYLIDQGKKALIQSFGN